MKKLLFTLAALFVLCAAQSSAKADTLTFTPSPVDLNDLDHHSVYTWKVSNVNLNGKTITGARITIKNIANWDSNPNRLFIHLLDNARYSGVRSFIDDPTNSSPVTDIRDDFVDPRYHNRSDWLVANGTADTFLTSQSFTMTPTNFVYDFTQAQIDALFTYISNGGNFALGFDPDCHFFNDYIKFEIFTSYAPTPTPEPATIALLGTGLAGLYARRRRKANRAA